MTRIDSFYKARPTLAELFEEDSSLFATLTLPAGVELSTLVSLIIVELGELDTICKDAAALKTYHAAWSAKWLPSWTRMQSALTAVYNPISNYDRVDVESIGVETSGGDKVTTSTERGGSDVTTRSRQGFDSTDFVGTDKDVYAPGQTSESVSETELGAKSDTERTLHSSGNIGVTTSQQMLEAEMRLREEYSLYGTIVGMYRRDICVGVW